MVFASTSVAVTVYAVELFSETLFVPPEEMSGDSFTLVTVIATALVTDVVPSDTRTIISYTLFTPLSLGASKFGGALNVTFPDASMLHNDASTPEME